MDCLNQQYTCIFALHYCQAKPIIMKTKSYFFHLLVFLFLQNVNAQTPDSAILEINNVKVQVNANGALFTDFTNGQFIAPHLPGEPEISTFRAAGIWIAGLDPGGNLKGAIQLYNETGKADFQPGTLDKNGSPSGQLKDIFRVTKEDIEEHRADFNDNGVIDNPNPNVFGWPAQGNPHFSQYNNGDTLPNPTYGLAGFWDENVDGTYDPSNGDFPIVDKRGCHFDLPVAEILWFVFNDNTAHTESQMLPINIEIQCEAFAFDCQEPLIANSVFTRYEIVYRGLEDVDSLFIGTFADFDIGNPNDDFFGSSSLHNLFFGYNGDEVDEGGYENNPPVMSVKHIRGPLSEFLGEVPLSYVMPINAPLPLNAIQYYQLLSGTPQDYQLAPANGFFYDGNPNDPTATSEISEGNTPGNRRVLSSYGPFSLEPGAVNEVIISYTFYQSPGNTTSQNLEEMYTSSDTLERIFENCINPPHDIPCSQGPVSLFDVSAGSLHVFPNPAMRTMFLEFPELGFSRLLLFDLNGKLVFGETLRQQSLKIEIDIQHLQNGIYFLAAQKEDGTFFRQKLIIVGR